MKRTLTLMIGASLALATAALAQQTDAQPSPKKEGRHAEGQAAGQDANTNAGKQGNEGAGHGGQGAHDMQKTADGQSHADAKAARRAARQQGAKTDANAQQTTNGAQQQQQTDAGANTAVTEKNGKHMSKQERKAARAAAAQSASPAPAAANNTGAATQANNVGNGGGKGRKLDQQKVETIKTKYASFKAQPHPDKIPAVTFNQSYRINGAERWQGPQYEVFRSYHPEMHDQGFYRSHYGDHIQMFGGGAYYWNNGYWYPAWGYDNSYAYYPYDGPIYVGRSAVPADQMIATVQAQLQEMGYYHGEVDGLLGPLTREALAAYQQDNGLYATAVMDEPTLNALGVG